VKKVDVGQPLLSLPDRPTSHRQGLRRNYGSGPAPKTVTSPGLGVTTSMIAYASDVWDEPLPRERPSSVNYPLGDQQRLRGPHLGRGEDGGVLGGEYVRLRTTRRSSWLPRSDLQASRMCSRSTSHKEVEAWPYCTITESVKTAYGEGQNQRLGRMDPATGG
jgi:hypothetical protein